jgi:hypothetical protein
VRRQPRFEQALAPALRRIEEVRLIAIDGHLRAEVHGIGHRLPACVPVSVALAARLVEAGAPLTVQTELSSRRPAGASRRW